MTDLTETDRDRLRDCIRIAEEARAGGAHPFGSLVVDAAGRVVAALGNNSVGPYGDPTQHAELRVVAAAARELGAEGMRGSTLYTSAEPCVMCSGAAYWTGVDRVVYALSEERLLELTGAHPENPTFSFPCREVFARGQRDIAVTGPALEDEAAAPHLGFWV